MPGSNDYKTGNLLDCSCHQNYYKLIGIDLLRKSNTSIPHEINFTEELDEDNSATMFLLLQSSKKL